MACCLLTSHSHPKQRPSPLQKYDAMLLDRVFRVVGKFAFQVRHAPFHTLESALQNRFQNVRQLPVGHSIASGVDQLIANARFGEKQLRAISTLRALLQ